MRAPKSDFVTAPQYQSSESWWSQHSESAIKVHGLYCAIKLPKSRPWPTDQYMSHMSCNCKAPREKVYLSS